MSPKSKGRKTKTPPKRRARPKHVADEVDAYFSRDRYTPPKTAMARVRPSWHKAVGWASVGIGLLIVVLNYAEEFDIHVMPGGHQEAYFLLGIVLAASGSWWLGVFDRPPRS